MRNGRDRLDEALITRRHVLQAFAAIGGSSLVMGTMDAWGLMGSSAAKRPVLVGRSPGTRVMVLGAGIYSDAPEYGEDTLSSGVLPRLRYGAYLHRRTELSVLVTGGRVFGEGVSEGELMKVFLETELRVEVAYVETVSLNTAENAQYTRQILEPLGVGHVVVVTHASHMARAVG